MNRNQLTKATITTLKGPSVAITVMFNPTEYSLSEQILTKRLRFQAWVRHLSSSLTANVISLAWSCSWTTIRINWTNLSNTS